MNLGEDGSTLQTSPCRSDTGARSGVWIDFSHSIIFRPFLVGGEKSFWVVAVHYSRTYEKAVRVGGGGLWRTCDMRYDRTRGVTMKSTTKYKVRKQLCNRSCSNHSRKQQERLVVRSCTSHPGVSGSISKREEPGKTGNPVLKYRVPLRVPMHAPSRAPFHLPILLSHKIPLPCVWTDGLWTLEHGVSSFSRLRERPEGPKSCQPEARRSSRRSSQRSPVFTSA